MGVFGYWVLWNPVGISKYYCCKGKDDIIWNKALDDPCREFPFFGIEKYMR